MTRNHSDRPILRRIFATTTHQRDSHAHGVGSTSNTTSTAASFHSCKSIITHVESRWIVVNGGASDGPEIKEGSQIEEIEGAEDIPANDDDSQFEDIEGAEDIPANDDDSQFEIEGAEDIPGNDDDSQFEIEGAEDSPANDDDDQIEKIEGVEDIPANDDDSPIHMTYQFDNCHVYMNSFNAHGVKVKNSGNNAPRITHHGPNEGPSSFSKLSRPSTQPKGPGSPAPAFSQSSHIHQDYPPDPTVGSPPPFLFQQREDNSSYTSDDSPSAPPVGIDVPFPTFEQKQSTKRDKLPTTVDAKLMQSNPAPTTLPGPESQPHPINPFLPIHMGLRSNFLSHTLQPFPDDAPNNNTANNWNDLSSSTNPHPHHHYPETPNSSRHRPDTNSKSLEHHLDSTLEIIQTSGILADDVTPQARNTLKAINSLVYMETPTYGASFRSKSVRKVAKWLQIPRSPK